MRNVSEIIDATYISCMTIDHPIYWISFTNGEDVNNMFNLELETFEDMKLLFKIKYNQITNVSRRAYYTNRLNTGTLLTQYQEHFVYKGV